MKCRKHKLTGSLTDQTQAKRDPERNISKLLHKSFTAEWKALNLDPLINPLLFFLSAGDRKSN